MFEIGMPELVVILFIALLIFGPSKLPDLGKSLSEAIRGFKKVTAQPDRTHLERFDNSQKSSESFKA